MNFTYLLKLEFDNQGKLQNMFTWLNNTGVQSDLGFIVQSIDRFTIEYREGNKKISVEVENGFDENMKPCVIIVPSVFNCWDDDPSTLPIEKQKQMLENFTQALEFQELKVVVDHAP